MGEKDTANHGAQLALGRQVAVEFYDCSAEILADVHRMEEIFLRAARGSGAHVVNATFHSFEPQGVSGVLVISESHFAVHAWPEHDYAAVDLFTCGSGVDFDKAIGLLAEGMNSRRWMISSVMNRGILHAYGQIEKLTPVVGNELDSGGLSSWEERFRSSDALAMASCIDVYDCRAEHFSSGEMWKNFADRIAELLMPGRASGQWIFSPEAGNVEFFRTFGSGRIVGFVHPVRKTVYLNLFTKGFFNPRQVAETAMELLQGRYYRMQPQIRQ